MKYKQRYRVGRTPKEVARPLALHVRRHRRWYGRQALTQRELARIAGVSIDLVYRYEGIRTLPRAVIAIVRLALALEVAVEELLAPTLLDELKAKVEERRRRVRPPKHDRPPRAEDDE